MSTLYTYTYIHNIIYRDFIITAKKIWCDRRCKEIKTQQSDKYIITVDEAVEQQEHKENLIKYNGPHKDSASRPSLVCTFKKRYWINKETKKPISPVLKTDRDQYKHHDDVTEADLPEHEAHKVTETELDWAVMLGIIYSLFLYYLYIICILFLHYLYMYNIYRSVNM